MKPSLPDLAVPLEEAQALLDQQLQRGAALAEEARRWFGHPKDLGPIKWFEDVHDWSSQNGKLLSHIFTSPYKAEEFAHRHKVLHLSANSRPPPHAMHQWLGELSTELKELKYIRWGLARASSQGVSPEAEPSLEPEETPAEADTPSAPGRKHHAVQSTSVRDLPSAQDLLGFAPHVEALAAFLANERTQPPLTLSIEGEWGSGKSSFMLQLQEALRRELQDRARFIRFNAWRHDRSESLWAAFALEFSRQLVEGRSWFQRRRMRLRLGLARLQKGQGWLGVLQLFIPLSVLAIASWVNRELLAQLSSELKALGALVTAPLTLPIVQRVWSFFGNPFSVDLRELEAAPDYEDRVPFLEQFHEDFRLLMETYSTPGEKVFVFVDDLDRCEVPKSAELLQALNLMIPEDSRVIFILGVDREKVAAGIAMRHEKLLPLVAPPSPGASSQLPFDPARASAFGRDFLERFIQLPFSLPRPQVDRLDALLDHLMEVPASAALSRQALEQEPERQMWLATRNEPLSAQAMARRAEMRRKVESDDPEVREVVKLLAPSLDFNMRRLKQFLNAFRLSIYIANNTGLFDSDAPDALSLSQLGKFVALGLRWPELLDDLETQRGLIAELEDSTLPATCRSTERWRREHEVLGLLRAGLVEGVENTDHSLRGVDLRRLRSVSALRPHQDGGELRASMAA